MYVCNGSVRRWKTTGVEGLLRRASVNTVWFSVVALEEGASQAVQPMSDVRYSNAAGKELDSTAAQATFPQFPGEDFLAHSGAQYMDQVVARLADLGLLAVAKDGADPDSVKELVDY